MNAATRPLRALAFACAVLLCAAAAPAARGPACIAPSPQPEAREAAFDVQALFAQGGVELSATGRARVATLARALQAADIEVVVVRVPLASDTPAAEARRLLAQKRAQALREHLGRLGIAPQRIYTEAAGPAVDTEPVVIETIAAWSPEQVALRRTCSTLA